MHPRMFYEIVKLFLDDRGKENDFPIALRMKLFLAINIRKNYVFFKNGRNTIKNELSLGSP
ncbi:hypothetical protein NIES208_11980 [[Limnothrix rosea] IAM M-220]|nr:hypothetical protein NIES208_11980 [[Limnothrix rosea] IAM M-220]